MKNKIEIEKVTNRNGNLFLDQDGKNLPLQVVTINQFNRKGNYHQDWLHDHFFLFFKKNCGGHMSICPFMTNFKYMYSKISTFSITLITFKTTVK